MSLNSWRNTKVFCLVTYVLLNVDITDFLDMEDFLRYGSTVLLVFPINDKIFL